jgi:hypothetical protein
MSTLLTIAQNAIFSLNNSKYFAGIAMLIVNIGSRYVTLGFSKSQEEFIKSLIIRELLIFSIIWMATRDIYIAITMTASFIILSDYLLNENSSCCVLPEKYKQLHQLVDTNTDGLITPEEIKNAEEILRKAKKQDRKINQLNMMSYFQQNLI